MHNRTGSTLLAFILTLTFTACSDSEPTTNRPPAAPSASVPPPEPTAPTGPLPSPDDADAAPSPIAYCDKIAAWCPPAQLTTWPLGEHEAEWLGQERQCYCTCTVNEDCAASPNPSECGFVFDAVINPPAPPEKKQRFDTTTVCRYGEFQQAF